MSSRSSLLSALHFCLLIISSCHLCLAFFVSLSSYCWLSSHWSLLLLSIIVVVINCHQCFYCCCYCCCHCVRYICDPTALTLQLSKIKVLFSVQTHAFRVMVFFWYPLNTQNLMYSELNVSDLLSNALMGISSVKFSDPTALNYWQDDLSCQLSVVRSAHLGIVKPRDHKLENLYFEPVIVDYFLTCPSLLAPTVSVHWWSLISVRISHASSAQVKTALWFVFSLWQAETEITIHYSTYLTFSRYPLFLGLLRGAAVWLSSEE